MDDIWQSSASVTIWNVCLSEIQLTRVYLRQKSTVFDSETGGPLRSFLLALGHAGRCLPFQVLLEQMDDGGHKLMVLPVHAAMVVNYRREQLCTEVVAHRGIPLTHGHQVRIYYKLVEEGRMAGPFALEYLSTAGGQPESIAVEGPDGPAGQQITQKLPPRNLLQLPEEMLRKILSNVPSENLFYNVSAVCQHLNEIVRTGIPFEHFKIDQDFTVEEQTALERMIDSAPPLITAIEGIWFDKNDEPTAQSLFFVRHLTERAVRLKLEIFGETSSRPLNSPLLKLQLKKLLPPGCVDRLKYLEVCGCWEFDVQTDCCFEELEQLRLCSSVLWNPCSYDLNGFSAGSLRDSIFPKLKSLDLLGKAYHMLRG